MDRLPDTPVVIAAAAAAGVGTAVGRAHPGLAVLFTVAACAAAGLTLGSVRRGARVVALAVACLGLAAGGNAAWRGATTQARVLPVLAEQDAFLDACGMVTRERPRSVEVSLRTLSTREGTWRVREPALVAGTPIRGLREGERFCAEGVASPPRRGRPGPPLVRAEEVRRHGIASPIRFGASVVRGRFKDAATHALPERQAGLLFGMTTGSRDLLDEDTVEAFRTTGLAHLVAVSGFHVAVVLGLLIACARALVRRGRWLRVGIVLPPLIFFAFLAGLAPSVLRATVTAGIVLAVTASGRTSEGLRVAGVAFTVLVLASPDLLTHPGFQMSFGATIGIILWGVRLADAMAGASTGGPRRFAATLVGTAVAAQLGVAPVLAVHFGRIPGTGGIANLVAVPVAPVVIGGGLATLTAASLWSGLGWAPAAMRLPIDVILWSADRFSRLPGASVDVGPPLAVAFTALGAAALAHSRRTRLAMVALALFATAVAGGRTVAATAAACPGPEVRAVDVGQGTAVVLRADDVTLVADGGRHEARLAAQLRALGVRRVDAIIASHPHADHTEGLVDVIEALPVDVVLAPAIIGWGVGRDVVEAAERRGVPIVMGETGDRFDIGPVHLEILSPDSGPLPPESPDRINAYNLVVRARVGGIDVLLPGDANGQAQLLLVSPKLRAPILVAPHHGSADVMEDFVDAVAPDLTLVTVGEENPYGHPAERALTMYESHGAVFRTDRDGWVAVCIGETGVEVLTER